ncbi:stalk domain-containing protein [Brevibacillus ginsengisoli]|uniref:stalk domain-containing protein n=1 Tax=Brevibacillus ginsengisoli TaxID=363854 RepID=UPI003CE75420
MNSVKKTSLLICVAILVVFSAVGVVIKWPQLSEWFHTQQASVVESSVGADPFLYDPLVPSLIKNLHVSYKIAAELHTNEASITGKETILFDNPKAKELYLYVYDYTWSPMRIKAIRYKNKGIPFRREGTVIRFDNVLGSQSRGAIEVEFESMVPRSGTRYGVKDDIWTLTNWYPMLGSVDQKNQWYVPPEPNSFGDPFVYHYADYDLTFTSPEAYQWVTSWGLGKAQPSQDGRKSVEYHAKKVLNFALVGSPMYHIETVDINPGHQVHIATTNESNLSLMKSIAQSAFEAYISEYGALPYPEVAIAETGANTTFAMEYANMAIFSKDMYANNLIDHWLPHEIAHMYWYNSISTIEPIYGWLDEGMAEASLYFYDLKRHGKSQADSFIQEYTATTNQLSARYPFGKLGKNLNQFETRDEFSWTWYSKGAMLYHRLRDQIGDAKFKEFLQRVQRSYHGFTVGPEHLDQALGQTLRGEAHYFVPNVERINQAGFAPIEMVPYVDTVINDMAFYPNMAARIQDNTVYLPVAEIMQKLGYHVVWNEEKRTIHMKAGNKEVIVHDFSNKIQVNGHPVTTKKPTIEVKSHVMVPLEFFSQVMGYQVHYDKDTRVVQITVPERN